MADAIKSLWLGLQANRDTAPTTWIMVPPEDMGHKLNRNRQVTNEWFGVLARARKTLRGGEYDGINIKSNLYYKWHGNLLSSLLKLPTTGNHAGETTIKDHAFVEATSPPLIAARFDNGVNVWQMLNGVVTSGKWSMPEEKSTTTDFDIVGDPATISTAPGVSLSLAAYEGPADWPQLYTYVGKQQVIDINLTNGGTGYTSVPTVGFTGGGGSGAAAYAVLTATVVTDIVITNMGTGYTSTPTVTFTGGGGTGAAATAYLGGAVDIMSGDVSIDRMRKPRFPSRRNVAPSRFVESGIKVTFSLMPDYQSDSASLFKLFRKNGSLATNQFPTLEFNWKDTRYLLGTVPSNPEYYIQIPNPLITTSDHDIAKAPTETPIKGEGGYDAGIGGMVKVLLTNDQAAYATS